MYTVARSLLVGSRCVARGSAVATPRLQASKALQSRVGSIFSLNHGFSGIQSRTMFVKRAKAKAKREAYEKEQEEHMELMAFEDANSNEELQRYPQMLVIDLDGKNLGVIKFEQAWELAQSKDSDLLLVKDAEIPVVRIVPPRSIRNYQRQMKEKEKKKVLKVKELRFRDVITEHDLGTKVRNAISFFKKGHKVKLQLGFKRRYDFDPESAIAIMQNIVDRLTQVAIIDGDVKFSNLRYATQMMSPKGGKSPKNARTEVGAPREEVEKVRKEAIALREGKNPEDIEDTPEFLDLEDDKDVDDTPDEPEPAEEYKSLQDQMHEQFLERKTKKGGSRPAPASPAKPSGGSGSKPAASSPPPSKKTSPKQSSPQQQKQAPESGSAGQPKWSSQSR